MGRPDAEIHRQAAGRHVQQLGVRRHKPGLDSKKGSKPEAGVERCTAWTRLRDQCAESHGSPQPLLIMCSISLPSASHGTCDRSRSCRGTLHLQIAGDDVVGSIGFWTDNGGPGPGHGTGQDACVCFKSVSLTRKGTTIMLLEAMRPTRRCCPK